MTHIFTKKGKQDFVTDLVLNRLSDMFDSLDFRTDDGYEYLEMHVKGTCGNLSRKAFGTFYYDVNTSEWRLYIFDYTIGKRHYPVSFSYWGNYFKSEIDIG